MSALADIHAAFALLTIVPGAHKRRDAGTGPSLVAWFPFVGLLIGVALVLVLRLFDLGSGAFSDGRWVQRAAWVLASGVVSLTAVFTRLLHWDGFADVADAWWGGYTLERRHEIMSDSSVGAFAAVAVALAACVQVAAIAVLLGNPGLRYALLATPVFGRTAIVFAAWLGRPVRESGLGASVMGRPSRGALMTASATVLVSTTIVTVMHGLPGLTWCVLGVLVAGAVPHVIAGRFDGVTGDVMGASVVWTETLVLLGAALVVTF